MSRIVKTFWEQRTKWKCLYLVLKDPTSDAARISKSQSRIPCRASHWDFNCAPLWHDFNFNSVCMGVLYLYLDSKHLSIGLPFPETTWNKNYRLHPGCHLLSFGSPPVWAPRTRRPNHCFHRISAASPPSPTKPSGSLIAHPLDSEHQLWCFPKLYLKPNLPHMSFVKRATCAVPFQIRRLIGSHLQQDGSLWYTI